MDRTTWKLFEPCRDDEHGDCSQFTLYTHCSCDCHAGPDDDEAQS